MLSLRDFHALQLRGILPFNFPISLRPSCGGPHVLDTILFAVGIKFCADELWTII